MMRRVIGAGLAVAAAVSTLATVGSPAQAGVDGTSFSGEDVDVTLRWVPCYDDITELTGESYECATARLPLDYDRLDAGKIPIELLRVPATGTPQGSLLLNPGGPGGSGIEFAAFAAPFFSPGIRENYDLVGFDPRGILRSNPLLCFGTLNAAFSAFAPIAFPTNRPEERLWFRSDNYLRTQCRNRASNIINKMSSANVARDMEVLRAALGDEKLNFYGLSYGSVLGQVYAGLFPDKVGRVAIDGVIVMEDWVGDPDRKSRTLLDERLQSAAGAEDSWQEFLRLCDEAGADFCPIGPDAAARTQAVLDRLAATPLIISDPQTGEVLFVLTYSDLIVEMLIAMYNPASWGFLGAFFAEVEFAFALLDAFELGPDYGAALAATRAELRQVAGHGPNPKYPNFVEGFPGVTCVDSSTPPTNKAFAVAARRHAEEHPLFGAPWAWSTSVCKSWPGRDQDKFVGPYDPQTANPILVLTTRFDPATTYEQAVETNDILPNSALLTVQGWGHTTFLTSTCADAALTAFFVDGALPADGTVCDPDLSLPFQQPPVITEPGGDGGDMARRILVGTSTAPLRRGG